MAGAGTQTKCWCLTTDGSSRISYLRGRTGSAAPSTVATTDQSTYRSKLRSARRRPQRRAAGPARRRVSEGDALCPSLVRRRRGHARRRRLVATGSSTERTGSITKKDAARARPLREGGKAWKGSKGAAQGGPRLQDEGSGAYLSSVGNGRRPRRGHDVPAGRRFRVRRRQTHT